MNIVCVCKKREKGVGEKKEGRKGGREGGRKRAKEGSCPSSGLHYVPYSIHVCLSVSARLLDRPTRNVFL